ncbi:MAG: hypothetical protein NTW86_05540 [Candidatus Sumerlaeota bacterium]|nr:hypothetical protein [Candidatus Sumerlaeota bacterium]
MPIYRFGKGAAPAWCEMENFELIDLARGESRTLTREEPKEEIIVCRGAVEVDLGGGRTAFLPQGGKLDSNEGGAGGLTIRAAADKTLVFRALGRWRSINGSGLFRVRLGDPPTHDTPYDYVKTTRFDNHYHDCDEYWIFFQGECRVASEGKLYDAGPGDCVATGMGWHHDVVSVKGNEEVLAVYFEGTPEGQKRRGHLWEPKHGKATPQPDRV